MANNYNIADQPASGGSGVEDIVPAVSESGDWPTGATVVLVDASTPDYKYPPSVPDNNAVAINIPDSVPVGTKFSLGKTDQSYNFVVGVLPGGQVLDIGYDALDIGLTGITKTIVWDGTQWWTLGSAEFKMTAFDSDFPLFAEWGVNGFSLNQVFLSSLADFPLDVPTDGQVLTYSEGDGKWTVADPTGGGGASALDDLTDVSAASPSDGDALVFDGAAWSPLALGSAATANTGDFDAAGTAAGLVDDLSGVSNQATARTNLGLGSAATHASTDFEATGVAAALVDDLSGVTSQATARTNLGLGTAATHPATDFLLASNNLSDVTAATARTNLGLGTSATHASTDYLLAANNLSDVTAATARTNLGLGTSATHAAGDFLLTANNLSDVVAATARTNLGLGTIATHADTDYKVAAAYDVRQPGTSSQDTTFAIGVSALNALTSGARTIGIGKNAGAALTTASDNIAIGDGALAVKATGGTGSVAIGTSALAAANNSSSSNTAIGYQAGMAVTSGVENVIIGHQALSDQTTGNDSVAIGYLAGWHFVSGSNNVIVGAAAARGAVSTTSTSELVAIGAQALFAVTSGTHLTAVGAFAMGAVTSAANNTAVGHSAMANSTSLASAVAVGYQALGTGTTTSAAAGAVAVGYQAAKALTSGAFNTAVGYQALVAVTTHSDNTAVGYSALAANNNDDNTAVGYNSLLLDTGKQNTAVGSETLASATTGQDNTAIGRRSGWGFTSGSSNTVVGSTAMAQTANVTGGDNTAIGAFAGYSLLTSSNKNTILGAYAGYADTSGAGTASATPLSYAIMIGHGAQALVNNVAVIGSKVTAERVSLCLGNYGEIGGGVGVFALSDASTLPTTNPTGGGILYSDAALLKWRDSAGGVRPLGLGAAPPVVKGQVAVYKSAGVEEWMSPQSQRAVWTLRRQTNAAGITALGCAAPTTVNTGSRGSVTALDESDDVWTLFTSGTTNADTIGFREDSGSTDVIVPKTLPELFMRLKTGDVATSIRNWYGAFSGNPEASATPTAWYAAFRYDTGADGTAFWRCVTDDNTGTPTVTTTTVAYTTSTIYDLRIVWNSATSVSFYINGVLVATHTTHIPTATAWLTVMMLVSTLTTTSRRFQFNRATASWV